MKTKAFLILVFTFLGLLGWGVEAKEKSFLPEIKIIDSDAEKANEALLNEKNPKKALDLYTKTENKDGVDRAALNYNKGIAQLKSNKPKEAIESFEKSLISPKLHQDSLLGIGEASMMGKDYDRAINAYFEALVSSPKRDDIRFALQEALRKKKQAPPQKNKGGKKKGDNKKNNKKNKDQQKNQKNQKKQDQKQDKKQGQNKEQESEQRQKEQKQGQNKEEQKKQQKKQEQKEGQTEKEKKQPESAGTAAKNQDKKKEKKKASAMEKALKGKDKKVMMFHLLKEHKKAGDRPVEKNW